MAVGLQAIAVGIGAAGLLSTVIVMLCRLFYRLGKIEESKAEKIKCEERAELCASKFLEANGSAAALQTAVARVEEQQKAQAGFLERQMDIVERLERVVNEGIRMGAIGAASAAIARGLKG